MARLWRVEYAGACYHVINRGNYRKDLFSEEGEARSFEKALGAEPKGSWFNNQH